MKKIALLMSFVLIFSLFGCNSGNIGESSDNSAINSTKNSQSSENYESIETSETNSVNIEELESEIDRLNLLLSDANSENEDLLKQISDLEEKIKDKNNPLISQEKIYIKNGAYLLLKEYYNAPHYSLSIVYNTDQTEIEVIELNYIWTVRASPNGTKVILNDYEAEYTAHVYMYDVGKRETKELLMPNLPEYRTVEDMEWLDDRYFLFIVQYDTGLVVRGGDVYVYDTETNEYKAIIKSEDYWKFQTGNFDVYSDDFVIFNSWLDDGTANFTENKYHILTFDEIYDLIENNKILDLSKKESMLDWPLKGRYICNLKRSRVT